MKKLFTTLLLLVMMITTLGGCTPSGSSAAAVEQDFTFVVRASLSPSSFHPDLKTDDGAWPMNQNIFSRLVKLGPRDNVVPDLATSWEFSDDGMTLTFHLHEGVKWHDGVDFTSADVKWTYDTLIAESWQMSSNLATVDSIECPDDNTVVFHMKNPDVSIVAKLSWYAVFILPKHLYEGTDQASNPYNETPIGTGPFKFVSWEKDVAVTLERNDDYFGDKPYIKTLIFSMIPDEETAYQAFINGEIDYMATMPVSKLDALDGVEGYSFESVLSINRTYVTFNMDDELAGNLAVRQAIAYAIDQEAIALRCAGAGKKAETLISPVLVDYVDYTYTLPETDIAKAQQILEDAGFTKDADGYYITLQLDFFVSSNWVEVAATLQANLDKAGIKIILNQMEYSAWGQKVREDRNFQMAMLAGYQGPDVSGVSGRVGSTGSTNYAGYNNPEMDALLAKGLTITDVSERAKVYSEVQRIMLEDLPLIFMIDNGSKYVFKDEFTGYPLMVSDKCASGEFTYIQKVK
ncbi:MAG: ABC transporter substrate-binding protein [Erysipelotrichaceae bacterium]|jgi:peptide/nickel transport system substrate-binding protein|nr:ABC transporter substrate-binding protein [Erysipelotrichaceae bacterium]